MLISLQMKTELQIRKKIVDNIKMYSLVENIFKYYTWGCFGFFKATLSWNVMKVKNIKHLLRSTQVPGEINVCYKISV